MTILKEGFFNDFLLKKNTHNEEKSFSPEKWMENYIYYYKYKKMSFDKIIKDVGEIEKLSDSKEITEKNKKVFTIIGDVLTEVIPLIKNNIDDESIGYKIIKVFNEKNKEVGNIFKDENLEIATELYSDSVLKEKVDKMIERANLGLPPEKPYLSKKYESPLEFLRLEYGEFLSYYGASSDYIYQDQLRYIYPSRSTILAIKRKIKAANKLGDVETSISLSKKLTQLEKQYSDKLIWGDDLMKALDNYIRRVKNDSEDKLKLSDIVKTRSMRLNEEIPVNLSQAA